jgi:hypothetical protein
LSYFQISIFYIVETLEKELIEIALDHLGKIMVKDLQKHYKHYNPSLFIIENKVLDRWQ